MRGGLQEGTIHYLMLSGGGLHGEIIHYLVLSGGGIHEGTIHQLQEMLGEYLTVELYFKCIYDTHTCRCWRVYGVLAWYGMCVSFTNTIY